MKHLFTLFFIILFGLSHAQTQVSGTQSGTWTLSNSPYQVTGHITIPSGQTLTIEPGVTVNFQGHYRIYVDGKLLANGSESQPVLFTTDDISTGWAGIRLYETSDISVFNYCKFEYGKTSATGSYPDQHGGAVVLKDANAEFYHCTFENNDATGDNDGMGGAVYCMNTGSSTETLTKFIDCTFHNNYAFGEGGAIKFTNDGKTEITRCTFSNNSAGYGGGAILFYTAYDVHITQSLFYNNTSFNSGGGAIKTLNPQTDLYFTNCTFTQNTADGYADGGAVYLAYADAVFTNCIIYDNSQQYGTDVNIGQNATANFNYCDVDLPDFATGTNNLSNVNPQFVNASQGDFHLQLTSPCIDAGIDVGLDYVGNAPDIGCFEYGAASINPYVSRTFKIFPNPATDVVYIDLKNMNTGMLVVKNMTGQIFLSKKLNKNLSAISLSDLPCGIYLLKLETKQGIFEQKLIKK